MAATVGLAAAGLILVFLRPDWLPTALVATVFAEGISVGGLQISRVAAPIAVFIVLMRLAAQGRVAPLGPLRVLFAVGAYGAWALASTLWTDYPGSASTTYSGTAYALSSLALSLVYMLSCAALIERSQDLWRVARMVWLMSTVVGVIAVTEYILGSPRSLGLTGDANFFAALQVVALPIGVALATTVRRGPRQSVVLLGVAVTVCSILTSLSRGGILALGGVALLVLLQPSRTFFRDRRLKRALLVATAVAGATLLALSYADASRDLSRELSNRGWSIFNTGGSGRRFVWRAAIAGWREHPVRGLGYGAFIPQSNVLLRRTPGVDLDAYRLRPAGTLVHNAYLGSLAELGVIGLVLFLAVLAAAWSTLRRIVRQAEAEGQHSLATLVRALTLSLVGFALTSIFLSTETDRALWVLLGITLALPRLLPSVAALEGPSSPPGNLALRRRPRPATA